MHWMLSNRADPRALPLADRHYSRQKPGTKQFVPPGRCVVLLTPKADALWVTSWPFAQFVKHQWAGAWTCSFFRNESPLTASELNREALAATRYVFGDPPSVDSVAGPVNVVSFIDRSKVRPTRVRGRDVWGFTYLKAGWVPIGETKGGLLAFGMPADLMPEPEPYLGELHPYLYLDSSVGA